MECCTADRKASITQVYRIARGCPLAVLDIPETTGTHAKKNHIHVEGYSSLAKMCVSHYSVLLRCVSHSIADFIQCQSQSCIVSKVAANTGCLLTMNIVGPKF